MKLGTLNQVIGFLILAQSLILFFYGQVDKATFLAVMATLNIVSGTQLNFRPKEK